MNDLSDKLIIKIFHYLNIDELLNKTNFVCKKWYQLCKNVCRSREQLIIRDHYEENQCWFYNSDPINLANRIYCNQLNFFDYTSFLDNFSNLKYFKTNLKRNNFNLELLNSLSKLRYLEIDDCLYLNRDLTLILPDLELLSIFTFFLVNNKKLTIDSNQLKILRIFKLEPIKIINPSTIKYLSIAKHPQYDQSIAKFINLETLKVSNIECLNRDIVSMLPAQLSNLHLYTVNKSTNNYLISKDIVLEILNQKYILNKQNLTIYYQGIKIDERTNFDEYKFNKKSNLKLFYDNYHNLENTLSWVNDIMYNDLIKIFKRLDSSFFHIFNNIQLVGLKCDYKLNQIDSDQFSWFLNNCPNLHYLYIKNATFNQNFYDSILNCNQLMNFYLTIDKNIINLDYNFIFKFKLLKEFKTNQHVSMKLINCILAKLKLIEYIGFRNQKSCSIKKINLDKYKFRYRIKRWSNLELNELMNLCEYLELDQDKIELYTDKII